MFSIFVHLYVLYWRTTPMIRKGHPKTMFLLLMPAVVWLFVNATVNRHSHLLAGGYIISHAHPFPKVPLDSGPDKSHQHSEKELFFLSLISDPVTSAITFSILTFMFGTSPRVFNLILDTFNDK